MQRLPLRQRGWLEFGLPEIALSPLIFHYCCRCSPARSIYLWKGYFHATLHIMIQAAAEFTDKVHLNSKLKFEKSFIILRGLGRKIIRNLKQYKLKFPLSRFSIWQESVPACLTPGHPTRGRAAAAALCESWRGARVCCVSGARDECGHRGVGELALAPAPEEPGWETLPAAGPGAGAAGLRTSLAGCLRSLTRIFGRYHVLVSKGG